MIPLEELDDSTKGLDFGTGPVLCCVIDPGIPHYNDRGVYLYPELMTPN
jgi:hypothetical protein